MTICTAIFACLQILGDPYKFSTTKAPINANFNNIIDPLDALSSA